MEKRHKKILIKCHETLVEDLDPIDVFPHLIQKEVLNLHHQERIKNIDPTRRGKNEELLTILPTRGPKAYAVFVKALEKTQPFLACLLLREGRYYPYGIAQNVYDIVTNSKFRYV